jgi:hypothetical protein
MPLEVAPMVEELNALLEHNERQAEEARRHAGNLAHALKTPLTVHHERRHRAIGRSRRHHHPRGAHDAAPGRPPPRPRARGRAAVGSGAQPAEVWPSLESVERAVGALYPPPASTSTATASAGQVHVERQDLDEMLGNLIENAAKYGGGSVFVTVGAAGRVCVIWVEDDGVGIPEADRISIFDRGVAARHGQARHRAGAGDRPRCRRNLRRRGRAGRKRGSGRVAGAAQPAACQFSIC